LFATFVHPLTGPAIIHLGRMHFCTKKGQPSANPFVTWGRRGENLKSLPTH
jgi:hypothetical protein